MLPANTPLYGHPLPEIEAWLSEQGCDRDAVDLSLWTLKKEDWSAKLFLDIDSIVVTYTKSDRSTIQRSFKYSLSRSDLEKVIFAGP
ncbi:MAG: DUF3143 domain-containing protein [Cyanobacteria bacterium P01_D01_bin.105]